MNRTCGGHARTSAPGPCEALDNNAKILGVDVSLRDIMRYKRALSRRRERCGESDCLQTCLIVPGNVVGRHATDQGPCRPACLQNSRQHTVEILSHAGAVPHILPSCDRLWATRCAHLRMRTQASREKVRRNGFQFKRARISLRWQGAFIESRATWPCMAGMQRSLVRPDRWCFSHTGKMQGSHLGNCLPGNSSRSHNLAQPIAMILATLRNNDSGTQHPSACA